MLPPRVVDDNEDEDEAEDCAVTLLLAAVISESCGKPIGQVLLLPPLVLLPTLVVAVAELVAKSVVPGWLENPGCRQKP